MLVLLAVVFLSPSTTLAPHFDVGPQIPPIEGTYICTDKTLHHLVLFVSKSATLRFASLIVSIREEVALMSSIERELTTMIDSYQRHPTRP